MTEAERKLAAIMFTDVVGYTALTEQDEPKAIQIRERHRDLVRPLVAQFQGQVIDSPGDEILSVFPSSLLAVDCALAVQASLRDDPDLKLRIGIHLGDILMRDAEVAGEGVNIASRIRPLADPGGICVSGSVYDLVRNRSYISARPLGSKSLKNVSQPVEVFALGATAPRRAKWVNPWTAVLIGCITAVAVGFALYLTNRAAIQSYLMLTLPKYLGNPIEQQVAFATTSDGVRIAYATSGSGPPVVFVLGWGTHLKDGMGSPLYDRAGFIRRLSARNTLVRYDGRGFGLSDRDVEDFSLEARVRDLEAVVDALNLPRFAVIGMSAAGPTVIAYAYKHPERVSKLLLGSTTVGPAASPEATALSREEFLGMIDLFRTSWSSPRVRIMWVETVMPQADEIQRRVLSEFLRVCCDGATISGFLTEFAQFDTSEMARQLQVPTLVIHGEEDQTIPIEHGRVLASLIPESRLEILEGLGHGLVTVPRFVDRVTAFLAEPPIGFGAPDQ